MVLLPIILIQALTFFTENMWIIVTINTYSFIAFIAWVYLRHLDAHFDSWKFWLDNHDKHSLESNKLISKYFSGIK